MSHRVPKFHRVASSHFHPLRPKPVSYTHLDVYKRQRSTMSSGK